jgi:hypothetical protein
MTVSVLAFVCLFKAVDDVLFLSGNNGAVFVIRFHFLDDLVYYFGAAQTRIGLGIALGSVEQDCRSPHRLHFRAAFGCRAKGSRGSSRAKNIKRAGGSDV